MTTLLVVAAAPLVFALAYVGGYVVSWLMLRRASGMGSP